MNTVRELKTSYDTIIVGARCAGASLATLLARGGRRVLVVDRAASGADTLSTHALMRPAVVLLQRWGLLDAIVASGATPVRATSFHYGDRVVHVTVKPRDGISALYAPRRSVIDRIFCDSARDSGATVEHEVAVTDLVRAPDGRVVGVVLRDREGSSKRVDSALVIGADGVRSTVARLVDAPMEARGRHATAVVYGHFPVKRTVGYHWYFRPGIAAGVIPTNDGLSCVFVGASPSRFEAEARGRLADFFRRALSEAAPELAIELAGVPPAGALVPFGGQVGFVRRAHGAGWCLVGDAGHFKDPITAHGMTDALRDAAFLGHALATSTDEDALEVYRTLRDDFASAWLDVSDRVASLAWDLGELQRLHLTMRDEMVRESETIGRLLDVGQRHDRGDDGSSVRGPTSASATPPTTRSPSHGPF